MKKEAIRRMKKLGLGARIIDAFANDGKIYCSDRERMVDVPENIQKSIIEWENKFGNIVYHVVHSEFMDFETYNCLSVSQYEEDWQFERNLMRKNWVMCHSINLTFPDFTESGSIEVININGILIRVN